jgi:hypothetical protein
MKFTAEQIATNLGIRIVPFVNKKTQVEDPKRTVLKITKDSNHGVRLGFFRKLTGLKPTTVKQSQTSLIAIFTSSTFSKKSVELPTVKLS